MRQFITQVISERRLTCPVKKIDKGRMGKKDVRFPCSWRQHALYYAKISVASGKTYKFCYEVWLETSQGICSLKIGVTHSSTCDKNACLVTSFFLFMIFFLSFPILKRPPRIPL